MREKLTFANVMSSIAVFLALGGSAMAIKANSVGSRQVRDGSIKGRDLADGKLKGRHLDEGAIGAREIDERAFDLEHFLQGRSTEAACDPDSTAFSNCGRVTLSPEEPSKVLLVGAGSQLGSGTSSGTCKFRINGSDIGPDDGDSALGGGSAVGPNGFGMTLVTDLLPPRPNGHTMALVCNETTGDVSFTTSLSALAFGGDPG